MGRFDGIFTYMKKPIQNQLNVGKYTSPMDPNGSYGRWIFLSENGTWDVSKIFVGAPAMFGDFLFLGFVEVET